jgi:phenylacetate-CoA ligase
MLAQQTTDSEGAFLANFASYYIEILDLKKDIPVQNGKMGRIVVTDLFNRAMPLIRYDTGDLGVFEKLIKNGKTQYFLKKVEGRKMDAIYNINGELISSFSVTNSMWKYTQLKQYQFIQIGHKDYEFRLNSEGDFLLEEELINEFKGYLGSDARIGISYVNEIPLLSSGKRKKVLNKMKSNNAKYSYAL